MASFGRCAGEDSIVALRPEVCHTRWGVGIRAPSPGVRATCATETGRRGYRTQMTTTPGQTPEPGSEPQADPQTHPDTDPVNDPAPNPEVDLGGDPVA